MIILLAIGIFIVLVLIAVGAILQIHDHAPPRVVVYTSEGQRYRDEL